MKQREAVWAVVLLLAISLGCQGKNPASGGAEGKPNRRGSQVAAKIHCVDRGVYRVTGEELIKGGLDLALFDPRKMTLVYTGRPVPIAVEGDEDGKFDAQDSFMFFAEGVNGESIPFINIIKDFEPQTQVFMLLPSGEAGEEPLRYKTVKLATPGEPKPEEYPLITVGGRTHYEDNPIWKFYEDVNQSQQKTNYLYWKELTDPPTDKTQSFTEATIDLPQVDLTQPLKLRAQFVGITEETWGQANLQHRLSMSLSTSATKTIEWPIGTRIVGEAEFAPGSFKAAQNTLTFTVLPPGGTPAGGEARISLDDVLLDWFELDFSQKTKLFNNYNEFYIPARDKGAGDLTFSIQEISGRDAVLLDLTHRERLIADPFEQRAGSFIFGVNVRLNESATTEATHLVALSKRNCQAAQGIAKVQLSDHFGEPDDCELLILAHPDFTKEVGRLAEWKRSRGLKTSVMDIADLFDEKGGGYASPEVLRDYIRHVYESQTPPRLKYVLLVGDSTTIAKYKTYLPAYSYLQSGAHANDNYFGAFKAPDALPEVAVGRFSVQNETQLRNAIDKTIAYEKGEGRGEWRNRALLIAASLDWAEQDAEEISRSHFASKYEVQLLKTDKTTLDPNYAEKINAQLVDYFNRGDLISIFLGHGGGQVWQVGPSRVNDNFTAHLFDQKNVAGLTNGRKLPLVIALTCYTNDFDNADVTQTLGETFVNSAAGAIAVIGAAQRTYTDANQQYSTTLLQVMEERKLKRLGDQFAEAKRRIDQPNANSAYLLLGDPSLEFELPLPGIEMPNAMRDKEGGVTGTLKLPAGAKLPATVACKILDPAHQVAGECEVAMKSREQTVRLPFSLTPAKDESMILSLVFYLNQGEGKEFNGGVAVGP